MILSAGMTELPTSFGKYFLTDKLATGGMAEIYLAKLVGPGGFEKQLVIKQIHPRLSGQRQFVDLFVAEAKTLVTLAHGNIVPVYELGVIDDTYFIAMEYIDGPTLHRLTESLARQNAKMEPSVAVWITSRMLEGLDYAHRKGDGVIHRDLSPRNVMLSRDGEVKLVDFGIAVTLGGNDDSSVTATSAPTGSFPYMSPEQVRREPLTAQTDVFSAGVLLWEMLVGERLFARSDAEATLAAVTTADIPRPSFVRPAVESKLDDVVMRALERNRDERFANAADMLAPLQRYLYGLEEMPGPRDVAALVGKYCPPEKRRLSTAGERAPTDGSGTPHTAVIPRTGASKRARTETFATNVDLKNMLERATPLVPIDAIRDEPQTAPSPPQIHQPPSRGLLVVAALGTLALGGGAIYVFARGRSSMLRPDAAPKLDAPFYAQEPDAPAPPPPPPALPDAPPPADAQVPGDASARPRVDAAVVANDATAKPHGNGTVKIGADPWGEIVIDGVPKGRTPAELVLPAGHHDVEVIYRGDDPPRKKAFSIDLAPDQTLPLQADFH
jgi:serine/threonine protein kinase